MRKVKIKKYLISRGTCWKLTVIALMMTTISFLGDVRFLSVFFLLSIPVFFFLYSITTIDNQYKEIRTGYYCCGFLVRNKIIIASQFRAIRIEKVIVQDLNTGGMGSTHHYHYFDIYLEYNEEDDFQIHHRLSEWELDETQDIAKDLGLEVYQK